MSSSQLITIGGVTKYTASNNGTVQGPAIANALSGISIPGQPLSGFSPWALAVKFKAFSGTETNTGIVLKWETEEEMNATDFTLERSDNGQTWSVVGSIPAKGNAASYSYTDYQTLSEILFYRIKTTDQNSQHHYSAVITVKKKISIDVFVTPNPATDEMQVMLPKAPLGKITTTLLNSAGQPMLRTIVTLAQNSFRLNLRTIRSGAYLLVISHNGEAIGKQMVVVK